MSTRKITKLMYKPKVSIITATWNRADLLPQAIKSILWQTYDNWELVIVDDGSTDNTKEVVKSFKDKRIKYINKGKHPYYTHVRNTGIKNSDGELLAFRDDDGLWHKDFLKEMIKPHKSPDVAITYCGRIVFENIPLATLDVNKIDQIKDFIKRPLVQWQGKDTLSNEVDVGDIMIKRSVFKGSFQGFSEELDQPGYCSDARLVDDIMRKNRLSRIVMVPKYLHYYFYNHKGKIKNMTIRKLEARKKGKMVEEKKWSF